MDKLKIWRADRGLSLDEAGRLVGVSGVQWHRYEAGSRRISSEKLPVIAGATGIPPHELRPDLADIFGPKSDERASV